MDIKRNCYNATAAAWLTIAVIFSLAGSAIALDGYQDRRGAFVGIGGGGGVAFQGDEVGGSLLLDLQLGGGFAENMTLALDVDLWFQWMGGYNNMLINPGPEMSFHFENGLYDRAGVAAALIYFMPDTEVPADGIHPPRENDFNIGFDGTLGGGWEVFFNSNVAVDLGVEADYIAFKGDDIINVGFILAMRYY